MNRMKRPALVTTSPTGSPQCSKCKTPLPIALPDSCPHCGRELDYTVYMIKSNLTQIKRKKDQTK